MHGFLTNAGAVSGITTTYDVTKPIALTFDPTIAGAETPMPQGAWFDHLEVRATNTGAVTTIYARLTWDLAGDQPLTAEGTITPVTSLTTTTVIGGVVPFGGEIRPPTNTLTVYAWLRTNANTIAVAAGGVRMHWAQSRTGG